MANETVNRELEADADCHVYYAIGGHLRAGPLTLINPDAPLCDLVAWACGELHMMKELTDAWRCVDGRDVDPHAPVATLQMMATRFKPLMKVMERANNITGQAAHAEAQAKLQ